MKIVLFYSKFHLIFSGRGVVLFIYLLQHFFHSFSHQLWTASGLCTYLRNSNWLYIVRICNTLYYLTHRSHLETVFWGIWGISGTSFIILQTLLAFQEEALACLHCFGRGAGAFVSVVLRISGPPPTLSSIIFRISQYNPLLSVILSIIASWQES